MLKKTFKRGGKHCDVTFTVTPEEGASGAHNINVAGDFNDWSITATPLKKARNGSFSVTLTLDTGKEYGFRYIIDGTRWVNDWRADKYVPAPYSNGEDNSVVVTSK